jgi:hypothetical protein
MPLTVIRPGHGAVRQDNSDPDGRLRLWLTRTLPPFGAQRQLARSQVESRQKEHQVAGIAIAWDGAISPRITIAAVGRRRRGLARVRPGVGQALLGLVGVVPDV